MIKELPRVLTIYDVDMPLKEARHAVGFHFKKHLHVKDERVIGLLIAKGYMELEETLMQWKCRTHLMRALFPPELTQKQYTKEERFLLNVDEDEDDEFEIRI